MATGCVYRVAERGARRLALYDYIARRQGLGIGYGEGVEKYRKIGVFEISRNEWDIE